MKRYITTITVNVFAASEEDAVHKATTLTKKLHADTGVSPEIENIEEFRTYGLNNKRIDFHKIQNQIKK